MADIAATHVGSVATGVPTAREIGLVAAAALVIGNTIGAGIFLLPFSLAPYGPLSLAGWIVTALGAITLALIFARLSRVIVGAGGPRRLHPARLRRLRGVLDRVGLLDRALGGKRVHRRRLRRVCGRLLSSSGHLLALSRRSGRDRAGLDHDFRQSDGRRQCGAGPDRYYRDQADPIDRGRGHRALLLQQRESHGRAADRDATERVVCGWLGGGTHPLGIRGIGVRHRRDGHGGKSDRDHSARNGCWHSSSPRSSPSSARPWCSVSFPASNWPSRPFPSPMPRVSSGAK